jgi:hypothetical protein
MARAIWKTEKAMAAKMRKNRSRLQPARRPSGPKKILRLAEEEGGWFWLF